VDLVLGRLGGERDVASVDSGGDRGRLCQDREKRRRDERQGAMKSCSRHNHGKRCPRRSAGGGATDDVAPIGETVFPTCTACNIGERGPSNPMVVAPVDS
jgi:hypothetical protein